MSMYERGVLSRHAASRPRREIRRVYRSRGPVSVARQDADRIGGIASMAVRDALCELCAAYARDTRQPVQLVAVGGVEAARRVREGEAFDFVVLAADAIELLCAIARIDPATRMDFARSDIAIAVAAGAPRPDVGSESTLRDAVLAARTIGYSTGPSGAYMAELLERWGIAKRIAPRLVQAAPGIPVGALVAQRQAELGFQQLSELMHVPGIDIVGLLPPAIRKPTTFSAAACTASARPGAARELLAFLASDVADAAKRRHGLRPPGDGD